MTDELPVVEIYYLEDTCELIFTPADTHFYHRYSIAVHFTGTKPRRGRTSIFHFYFLFFIFHFPISTFLQSNVQLVDCAYSRLP